MTKYYVESGPHLRVVVLANDFVGAILKALEAVSREKPLKLANVFIVNERGFVWDRDDNQLYGDEVVLPTRLVLGDPASKK